MDKYEEPKLVEITELSQAQGDCMNGYAVEDTCGGGDTVGAGCNAGAIPVALCGGGGTVTV